MSAEHEVVAAARAWRGGTESVARHLADAIERWLAELLAMDSRWPLQGRWFDGLLFDRCLVDGDRVDAIGCVIRVGTQRVDPFFARLALRRDRIGAFEVGFGDEAMPDGAPYETARKPVPLDVTWRFRFTRP